MATPDDYLTTNNLQAPPPDEVAPLSVTATPRSTLNYDNSKSITAMRAAQAANPPMGGSDNPGIWSLLPEKVQHGTLRNILGAIGDAFLVQSGHDPTYGPRMQRQKESNAMAGYTNNPRAAIENLFGTATPNSMEGGLNLLKEYQGDLRAREANQASADQHADAQASLNQNRQALADDRKSAALARTYPLVHGMLTAAAQSGNQTVYAQAVQRAKQFAEQQGLDFEGYGVPDSIGDYVTGTGMTANNIATTGNTVRGQDLTAQARAATNSTTQRGQDLAAQGRAVNAGIAQQNANTAVTRAAQTATRPQLVIPGLTVRPAGGASPAPTKAATAPTSQFKDGVVYTDAKGNKARYDKGKWVPVK